MNFDQMEALRDNEDYNCLYPFFAWQCISLIFETRTLDLVIKNENDMNRFIKFLIRATRSVDGTAGTADYLIKAATIAEIQSQEKRINRKLIKRRAGMVLDEHEAWDDSDLNYLTDE